MMRSAVVDTTKPPSLYCCMYGCFNTTDAGRLKSLSKIFDFCRIFVLSYANAGSRWKNPTYSIIAAVDNSVASSIISILQTSIVVEFFNVLYFYGGQKT